MRQTAAHLHIESATAAGRLLNVAPSAHQARVRRLSGPEVAAVVAGLQVAMLTYKG